MLAVESDTGCSATSVAVRKDEDREPRGAGRLERVEPIHLLTDTPEHRLVACLGTPREEVHGRRRGIGRVVAGGGNAPEG
jgi:hypothetical protein